MSAALGERLERAADRERKRREREGREAERLNALPCAWCRDCLTPCAEPITRGQFFSWACDYRVPPDCWDKGGRS